MSSAEDRMRAMMTGYRRDIAPRASDRVRVWERLQAEDRDAPVRQPRTMIIAAFVVLAAALLLLAIRAAPDRAAHLRDSDSSESVYETNAPPEAPAVPREPAPPTPTQAATPVPAPAIAADAEPPRATPALRGSPRKPAVASEDPLQAELRLIEAARAALDRGDHEAALARAGEHRRRFPDGALALEARSLRALALCGAGRWMQGRGEARALSSEDPTSPYRDRLRDACGLR